MEQLIEKFMNESFIVTHVYDETCDQHNVTSYNRIDGVFQTKYHTHDKKYAHLRFIQAVMHFLS